MKNVKRAFALATAAFVSILILTSASEWEGAGAIAGPGELPDTGLYVATNAFPRNTVVDVMNLENEKLVRVIVAGPLNAPGLLISLSREAASSLGLSAREVGRFRVSMPVDPVAYSRFTEGLASNADPDYNPMSAIERAGIEPAEVPPAVMDDGLPETVEVIPPTAEAVAEREDPPLVTLPPVEETAPVRPELVELPFSPREGQGTPAAEAEDLPPASPELQPEQKMGQEQEVLVVRVIEAPAEANPPVEESEALLSFDAAAAEGEPVAESGPEYSEVPGIARPQNGIHPDEEPLAAVEAVEADSTGALASAPDENALPDESSAPDESPAPSLPELVELPGSEGEESLPEEFEPAYREAAMQEIVEAEPVESESPAREAVETGPEVALVVEGERPANGIHPDEEPGTPDLRIVALEKSALSLEQAPDRPPSSGPVPELPADGEIAAIVPVEEDVVEGEKAVEGIAEGAPFIANLPPYEEEIQSEEEPRLDTSRLISSLPPAVQREEQPFADPMLPDNRELAAIVEEEEPEMLESESPGLVERSEEPVIAAEKRVAEAAYSLPPVAPAESAPVDSLSPGVSNELGLPVPVISSLVRGRYYLQICSVARLDNLARELVLHARYPLVVHPYTSGGKTVYQLLVGPVNQGESGALLSRFKRSGYRDAYIRKG